MREGSNTGVFGAGSSAEGSGILIHNDGVYLRINSPYVEAVISTLGNASCWYRLGKKVIL